MPPTARAGGAAAKADPNAPRRKAEEALFKQHSWSPDIHREQVWLRRKRLQKLRDRRHCRSVTDEDLDELEACFELGFGFDSPDTDRKLSDIFPALELYNVVNKQYNRIMLRTSSSSSMAISDCDSPSSVETSSTMFDSGDDPKSMKTKMRKWAQLVACAVRHSSPN